MCFTIPLSPAPFLFPVWLIYMRDWQADFTRKKEQEFRAAVQRQYPDHGVSSQAGYSVENAIREAGRDLFPVYAEENKDKERIWTGWDISWT